MGEHDYPGPRAGRRLSVDDLVELQMELDDECPVQLPDDLDEAWLIWMFEHTLARQGHIATLEIDEHVAMLTYQYIGAT